MSPAEIINFDWNLWCTIGKSKTSYSHTSIPIQITLNPIEKNLFSTLSLECKYTKTENKFTKFIFLESVDFKWKM